MDRRRRDQLDPTQAETGTAAAATNEIVGQKVSVAQGENVAALLKVGDRTIQAP